MTKRSELEEIRQSILAVIYKMSIELGLDPDTLDTDSFAYNEPNPALQNIFNAHCYKLQVVEKKLRELP